MLMLAFVTVCLSACGGGGSGSSADRNANQVAINGQVAIARSNGTFHSMEGADVTIYGLNKYLVLRGKQQVALGGSTVEKDGAIRLALPSTVVSDPRLYVVEITCPVAAPGTPCEVEAPIHLMLSGQQLKQSTWTASGLTEVIFQNLAYYVAAEYSADQLADILNRMASWMFNLPPSETISYQELVRWHPDRSADYPTIARAQLLEQVLDNLVSGFDASVNKNLAVQFIRPMLASADPGGWFFDIKIQNHSAFVTDTSYGLRVYDISKPDELKEIGSLALTPTGRSIVLYGDYAYVSARTGLHIVNIETPEAPEFIKTLPFTDVHSVTVSGQTLVVSDGENGTLMYSIINPTNPVLFRSFRTAFEAHKARLDGNILYALFINPEPPTPETGPGKLLVVDISQSNQSALYFGDSHGRHLALLPDYLYIVEREGITVFDRSKPDSLEQIGELPLNFSTTGVVVGADSLYLLEYAGDIRVIDIAQPANPKIITRITTPTINFNAAMDQQYLYVAGGPAGLLSIDAGKSVQPISLPVFSADRFARSAVVDRNKLYLLELDSGIQLQDITQPSNPIYVGAYEEPERRIRGFTLHNNIGYVRFYDNGIQSVDFTTPGSPSPLAVYDAGASASSVLIEDDVAFIDILEQGLHVVDISDPSQMVKIGQLDSIGQIIRSVKIGDYIYASMGPGGLGIIDVQNLSNPQFIGYVNDIEQVFYVAHLGSFAYVVTKSSGVHVLDITDPAAPILVTTIDLPEEAYHIVFHGQYAYIANHSAGVTVLDVSDRSDPEIVGTADTLGYAYYVAAFGDDLYVSTSRGVERLSLIKQ